MRNFFVTLLFFFSSHLEGASLSQQVKSCQVSLDFAIQGKWEKVSIFLKEKKCPDVNKLILWLDLKRKNTRRSPQTCVNFIDQNPNWPWIHIIRKNLEQIWSQKQIPQLPDGWFKKYPPSTLEGAHVYIQSLILKNQKEKARQWIRKSWKRLSAYSEEFEEIFHKNYKSHIQKEDYFNRIDFLIWNQKYKDAKKYISYLSTDKRNLIQARIALLNLSPSAQKKYKETIQKHKEDQGLSYAYIYWLWKKNKQESILVFANFWQPNLALKYQNQWNRLAFGIVREGMKFQQYQKSYNILKKIKKTPQNQAELYWLSGFISIAFLKKPRQAIQHFQNILKINTKKKNYSQALYWMGRSYENLHQPEKAKRIYKKAADNYPTTYYGQRSFQKIGRAYNPESVGHLSISQKIKDKINSDEFIRMVKIFSHIEEPREALPFIYLLIVRAKSLEEKAYLLEMTQKLIPIYLVDMAYLLDDNLPFLKISYPTPPLAWQHPNLDNSLVLGMIWKESGFNPTAKSSAGAHGLLQLMPKTAKTISQNLNIPFQMNKIYDPAYNLKLGQTYMQKMLRLFNGSQVLALSAYDAGPGNVKKWIQCYGDPRKTVDQDIWIEQIPFGETRFYIKIVLSKKNIYDFIIKKTESK